MKIKWKNKNGQNNNRISLSPANMEQNIGDEYMGKKKITRLDSPCCIQIHSQRHRLADSDGISGKALIDGFVLAGVLQDDSPKYIKEVRFTQEKISKDKAEKTIVKILPE